MMCVYALVPPSRMSPGTTGLRGERLKRVPFRRVHAIVGVTPLPPAATTANLKRYDAVVRRLAARFPAVLPSRFGTCVADVEELAFIVGSRGASFARALDLVRNRVQMTVRIFSPPTSVPHRHLRPTPPPPSLNCRSKPPVRDGNGGVGRRSGIEYLRERAAEEARARDLPGTGPLREAVARWITAERIEPHHGEQLAGTIYHLIRRSAVSRYVAALERAAAGANVKIMITGPWPPYAFAHWDV